MIAQHGLQVVFRYSFTNAPAIDILVVPGGIVTETLADSMTLGWLRRTAARAALTASVCTGAFLLAAIGLLDGLTATTHWENLDELRSSFPNVSVVDDVPYVDQGSVITSAGILAGIDMSLYLVGRLLGSELAQLTARQMQYDWHPDARDIPRAGARPQTEG